MTLRAGFGSGLTRRRGDPPGRIWAIGDRGPNVKCAVMAKRYGERLFSGLKVADGAKVMPRVDIGPALAELQVSEDIVTLLRTVPLRGTSGRPLTGLPPPGGEHALCEPALDLAGAVIAPDPSGVDSEGVTALADGSFWVGDEYGPSLLKLDAGGRVLLRWVPEGADGAFAGADYPVEARLPAIAGKRQLNRGFEALTLSEDERRLHLAFQSPLAHPDEDAHRGGRHVRFWTVEIATGAVIAQHLYPLDPPESFKRDRAAGRFEAADVKVSEIAMLEGNRMLVLERGSQTTKIYRVSLDSAPPIEPEHLDIATRPTIEQQSGEGAALSALAKMLLFSSDDWPEVGADLEGMALLGESVLLLVSDNDFGVEGAETGFWRLTFDAPL